MRLRVSELEKECSTMKQEIEKLTQGKTGWSDLPKKFGLKINSQMCSAQGDSVNNEKNQTGKVEKQRVKLPRKHKKQISSDESS